MKKSIRKRFASLLGTALAAAIFVSALPMAGLTASAVGTTGNFFTAGNPPFAYVITGYTPANAYNTVKLYQNTNMQSYANYNGVYTIPEQVVDINDFNTAYTVTEISGALAEGSLGALEGVALRGITLPGTVATIGARAFAGCTNLTEITFPTSVSSLAANAFENTNLQKLTLNVSETAILTGNDVYTAKNGARITLPRNISELNVMEALTVAGSISVPGAVALSNAGVTIQPGASFEISGALSGSGVIEVKNKAALKLFGSADAYRGSIRLTGAEASFTNNSPFTVNVLNAAGQTIAVPSGDTLLGEDTKAPSTPEEPKPIEPLITTNYGGVVFVEDQGKSIVISVFDGYCVEDVVINGLSMGAITRYEFADATVQNTVEVKFAEGKTEEGPQLPAVDPSIFNDIAADASYAEAVAFLKANGILNGVSANSFAPEAKTSRAMFISVLNRLGSYNEDFVLKCDEPKLPADVTEGLWYSDAAGWAAGVGIISPYGVLNANRAITREEAAVCLYRYTHARGYDTVVDINRYHAYSDSLMLGGESRKAMVWAATRGYIKSHGGTLDPAGTISRAELAEMFALYVKVN